MVKLKVKKIVKDGVKCYELINWEGILEKFNLPLAYRNVKPRFYVDNSNNAICIFVDIKADDFWAFKNYYDKLKDEDIVKGIGIWGDCIEIKKGAVISVEMFEYLFRQLYIAGEKLHEINKEIKEIKENWKGEEVFVI